MRHVLCDMVQRGSVTAMEAASILRDIFFNTANTLYNLELPLIPLQPEESLDSLGKKASRVSWTDNFGLLKRFLRAEPSIEFLRLQWLDYTSTLRLRILPIKQAIKMFDQGKFVGITKAVLGLLQHDITSHGFSTTGEFLLYPRFDGVRKGSRPGYATVQCEFQKENGDELRSCPRTVLRRQVENADTHGLNFLVGFEIEIVFMRREVVEGEFQYGCTPINEGGHAWSSARPLQRDDLMELLGTIYNNLERAGIEILQFHPESAPGQFEFVLSPLPPLLAVDTLIAARDIIYSAAANADMRATLYPKPFAQSCGKSSSGVSLSLCECDLGCKTCCWRTVALKPVLRQQFCSNRKLPDSTPCRYRRSPSSIHDSSRPLGGFLCWCTEAYESNCSFRLLKRCKLRKS